MNQALKVFNGLVLLTVASGAWTAPPVEIVGGAPLPGVSPAITAAANKQAIAQTATPDAPSGTKGRAGGNVEHDLVYEQTRVSLTIEPGVTELLPVARNYLNRLITPFEDPKVITVNPIEFKKEGSSVFITTTSERPVGVHILSNDPDDTRSISLALVPQAIPPRTVRLKWPTGQGNISGELRKAKKWEEGLPYVDTLMELLSATALRRIPDGYSLTEDQTGVQCDFDHFTIKPGQMLVGSHFSVYIMLAQNRAVDAQEIREEKCLAPGVAAVAAWPHVHLKPGESTELYVVVNNAVVEGPNEGEVRPSLLSREQ